MKRHSADEIASKLHQAEELMAGGRSQAQACKTLGISVMTYHRWRKAHPSKAHPSHEHGGLSTAELTVLAANSPEPSTKADHARIKELRLENDRLRRIVTDLLLEKVKIEEQIALNLGRKTANRN